ncbi:demethylmenaquinone methyltransferase [Actinobaculum sp. 313]|uniref:demethylmenaquinone methyltransferase n=1 Tax=Actinobaculum sp. 313 TaxID=2495645 RepID=UPI000D52715F|nr:demethylmenaquinone methyltransferase [Actinobaculum sp. 313]AWE42936.1 demethylmenaquinone methyltransferase [Actinobaculum sp. 313]
MERRATLEKTPADVAGMFDDVASRYDLTNTLASLGQVYVWREAVVCALDARAGMRIVDIAAGTGTSAAAYAARGADVVACDFSAGMLEEGKRRHPELSFVEADAMALPFETASFDAATISFGLRNVKDPDAALREMLRVTRPGGRIVIAEFSRPTWAPFRLLYNFYLSTAMPTISALFSSDAAAYEYLAESILAWPDQEQLAARIQRAGGRSVQYRNLSGGIVALHRATRN